MTRLLVAEKPSVARDLARVVGASKNRPGYLEGPGWVVTWCVGHLVELVEPHEYDPEWKRWSLNTLPMLPDKFRLRAVAQTASQFEVVRRLLTESRFSSAVNGCDAGREGELIFRYVYQLAGSRLPVERLWISSMTDQAIKDGLAQLRPSQLLDRLFDAARCRSEADWLVGLNATRAITVRSRQGQPFSKDAPLYSVGRVQTPTLALLVDREKEITDFRPQDYWLLEALFDTLKGRYRGRWFRKKPDGELEERFSQEAEALAIGEKVRGKEGVVLEVEQKRTKEPPPLLFDLTRLQRTANKRYGFSAARTLELAQALYERHKLLTYPRTDSTHLPSDLVPRLRTTIQALAVDPYRPFADRLLALEKLPISKRFVDDKKVSDHHAIIPTPHKPDLDRLGPDERKLYDLVVRRFLGVFFPDAVFDRTRVVTLVEGETFQTRGRVMVDAGWREVAGLKDDAPPRKSGTEENEDGDEEEQGALPPLAKGDLATAVDLEVLSKQTQPPPRHTEASLLAAMEGAGKLIDDEELAQAMKDSGLGTPATRASIIETLLARQYIYRKGKALMPTEKGIRLIAAVPVESLRSPQLTGEWEARLARMSRGEYPSSQFMDQVRAYVREVVDRIKRAAPIQAVAELPASDPKEAPGQRGGGEKPGGRSRGGQETGSSVGGQDGRQERGKRKAGAEEAKGQKRGAPAREASPKKPKKDEASGSSEGNGACPRCGAPVQIGSGGASCSAQARGCGFLIKREVAGKSLSDLTLKRLLEKGRTQLLKGFVSPKSGVKFDAVLFLKPGGGLGFEFKNRPEGLAGPSEGGSDKPAAVEGSRGEGPKEKNKQGDSGPEPGSGRTRTAREVGTRAPGEGISSQPVAPVGKASKPNTGGRLETASGSHPPVREATSSQAPERAPVQAPRPIASRGSDSPTEKPVSDFPSQQAPRGAATVGAGLGNCPLCRTGKVVSGKQAWGCSRWREGCGFMLPFRVGTRPLSLEEAGILLGGGKVGPVSGVGGAGAPLVTLRLETSRDGSGVELRVEKADGVG